MQFVTAAYGARYRRWALGLARSFRLYNPHAKLTIFSDGPVGEFDVRSGVLQIDGNLGEGRLELAIKTAAVSTLARETGDDVCWIDCDQLVLRRLTDVLPSGWLNVVGYGVPGEVRDCGNGIKLPQSHYLISGFFSMPPALAEIYLEGAQERVAGGDGHEKLMEQELLNRVAVRNVDLIQRIDVSHPHLLFNLGWPGGGHPSVENAAFCSLRLDDHMRWWIADKQVAMLCFVSAHIGKHIETGFSAFGDTAARTALQEVYAGGG